MIQRPLSRYFFFGTCARYLQDAQEGWLISDVPDRGWGVFTNLKKFVELLDILDLRVTARLAGRLGGLYEELSKAPDGALLSKDQADRLSEKMDLLRQALAAELDGLTAYSVTPKRFDVTKLLDDVTALFAPGVFAKLPEIARYDLQEAGKCIAFERPTAAAFHLLRATEAVLRVFYRQLVKQKRVTPLWGNIVGDLRKKRAARAHSVLLDNLDNIRRSFRNPTQHPEATYDIHETQDLWGLCSDAITRMASVLPVASLRLVVAEFDGPRPT